MPAAGTAFAIQFNTVPTAHTAFRYARFAFAHAGTDFGDWRRFGFELSDLAWVGAALFAARTWSGAYAFTDAFEARRKGYFERPWIERVVRFGRAPKDST